MEDNEARVIDAAIKFVQLYDLVSSVDFDDLRDAVVAYLEANGETLETY